VVAQYCETVVVMYAWKVVEEGSVRAVFGRPSHTYTAALLRAAPRVGQRIQGLPGTLPDLVDYPTGCPYAARCERVLDICRGVAPEMRRIEEREVSCHNPVFEDVMVRDAAQA
jgi:oligopeptide/dipeptide ABC transporter ATP-binding protein